MLIAFEADAQFPTRTFSVLDKFNLSQIYKAVLNKKDFLRNKKHQSFILPLEELDITVYGTYRKGENLDDDMIIISTLEKGITPEQEGY